MSEPGTLGAEATPPTSESDSAPSCPLASGFSPEELRLLAGELAPLLRGSNPLSTSSPDTGPGGPPSATPTSGPSSATPSGMVYIRNPGVVDDTHVSWRRFVYIIWGRYKIANGQTWRDRETFACFISLKDCATQPGRRPTRAFRRRLRLYAHQLLWQETLAKRRRSLPLPHMLINCPRST